MTRAPMRLLVCGGRDYADFQALARALAAVNERRPISVLINGGATGADKMARMWATMHCIPVETYEADWRTHGRAAGPIRNKRMLVAGRPDGVVAFPGGRGTADMIRQAEAVGIVVWKV